MALLEVSLVLNKAGSRQECQWAFRLDANAVQGPKLLQPEGLRRHGLPAALLMSLKPAGILRHERLADESRGARNNAHSDLGNSPTRIALRCTTYISQRPVTLQRSAFHRPESFPMAKLENHLREESMVEGGPVGERRSRANGNDQGEILRQGTGNLAMGKSSSICLPNRFSFVR